MNTDTQSTTIYEGAKAEVDTVLENISSWSYNKIIDFTDSFTIDFRKARDLLIAKICTYEVVFDEAETIFQYGILFWIKSKNPSLVRLQYCIETIKRMMLFRGVDESFANKLTANLCVYFTSLLGFPKEDSPLSLERLSELRNLTWSALKEI